jgi:thioesterase domain-containing protein
VYQGARSALFVYVPPTELYVIHPGGLSVAVWSRLASHMPAGTAVRVQELETVTPYWADDPKLTVDMIADRLRSSVRPDRPRVIVGWGFGGVVAAALAARAPQRPKRVVVLDSLAPGARGHAPGEAELLRSFSMYLGARRGLSLAVEPARLEAGLEPALSHLLDVAIGAGALREGTPLETLHGQFADYARGALRDHRLTETHVPTGLPLTVVKATGSLLPASRALGWQKYGPVEVLGSGGDHYSMLTEPAAAAHLAMLLHRWLAPAYAAA